MESPHTVYKVELTWPIDTQKVRFPKGAELLTVQLQGDRPCVWARCQPDRPLADFTIRIAGTGHALWGDAGKYLGTFQLDGGALIFHAFGKESG